MATQFGKECFCSNEGNLDYGRHIMRACTMSCAGNEVRWRCFIESAIKNITYHTCDMHAKKTISSDYPRNIESGDMKGTGNTRFPLASCFIVTRRPIFD